MAKHPFQFSEMGGFGINPGTTASPSRQYRASEETRVGSGGIGYDAVTHKGRRATPLARTLHEDLELRQYQRRQLITNHRDLNRNFSILAWMVRRHLDSVATFHFRSKTGNTDLDKEINKFMGWYGLAANCDPMGRFSLLRMMRMWELRRVLDGDTLINRLADGRIQTIEGDRIQSIGGIPFSELGIDDPRWVVNGVWINQNGRPISYMVFKRLPWFTGLQWDRAVPARFADLFGYYDRVDQCRGVSPLASAANNLRDVYEGFDYALLKAKISQFFAMVITRNAADELGEQEERENETNPNADPNKPRYDVNMGRGGVMLDLDPGDKAEVIESQTPSNQFQDYSKLMIMVVMKALDLPYSFFDEAHTNYSGARMAGSQFYDSACKLKQHDMRTMLDKQTRWRLGLAVADGDITLPRGTQFNDLAWEWTHAGTPLYDPQKEITASMLAINAGLSSHEREAKRLGLDVYELIDEIARVQEYAKSKGVTLSTDLSNAQLVADDKSDEKQMDTAGAGGGTTGKAWRTLAAQNDRMAMAA